MASSVAATLATAPVTIANFGTMSLVGVAVNVLVAPLAGPVVIAALAGAVVGVASPSLGEIPTLVAGWGASLIADIARAAATLPGASRSMSGVGIALTVAIVVAIPVARWWLWSAPAPPDTTTAGRGRSGRVPRRGGGRSVSCGCGARRRAVAVSRDRHGARRWAGRRHRASIT